MVQLLFAKVLAVVAVGRYIRLREITRVVLEAHGVSLYWSAGSAETKLSVATTDWVDGLVGVPDAGRC